MTSNDEKQPIILESLAWKRRGGFGKFSESVGAGSSWQRRRITLTAKGLSYYNYNASSDSDNAITIDNNNERSRSADDDAPRGTLNILPDHATVTATYPGDVSQPTPYALVVKTIDGISQSEITKWKLCFDDRETQLLWLVALTDIVAEVSVAEFNARILSTRHEHHEGFHRLYEEGNCGKLLDLLRNALQAEKQRVTQKKARGEGIEIVHRSIKDFHVVGDSFALPSSSSSTSDNKSIDATSSPDNKVYQAFAVLIISIAYEKCAKQTPSHFSILINVIILCIFLAPSKSNLSEKGAESNTKSNIVSELNSTHERRDACDETNIEMNHSSDEDPEVFEPIPFTKSMVGTELMKAQGVPLSEIPSQSFSSFDHEENDDVLYEHKDGDRKLHRPLTVDEMHAHSQERWAVSAPEVDLSGEWTLIADENFKRDYDTYLKQLGFNGISRKVACSLIARTTEVTKQSDHGRKLYLKGTNPKGSWERILVASGYPDFDTEQDDCLHTKTSIKTADSEDVVAEAWWEECGTKHRSWLRGGSKYGGGDHESVRFIDSNDDVLVCESTFHPKDASKMKAFVTWRFQRK